MDLTVAEHYKGLLEEYERPDYAKYKRLLQTAIDRQSGKPQAIMKITGYLSSAEKMGDHIDYISRNGTLELTDQDGFTYHDKKEKQQNIDEWAVDFTPVSKKQSHTKYALRVDAGSERNIKAIYETLKLFGADHLQGVQWRVDKSRSKKTPNTVTLAVTAPSERAGVIRENLEGFEQDHLSTYRTTLKEHTGRLPRNAMKMALSSPEGTNPKKVQRAAEAFAKEAFGDAGYRYLYALHTDTNNAHVHLVVKMVNDEGVRLKTEKVDLYRWRELWAEKSREQGIDVVAVPNYMRGVSSGKNPNVAQMIRMKGKRKGYTPTTHYEAAINEVVSKAVTEGKYTATRREIAAIKRNLQTRQEYIEAATMLRNEVRKLTDGKRQQQLVKMAAILEKEAKAIPLPKTPVQRALEKEGKKTGISIKTILPKGVVEQFKAAFRLIDQRTQEAWAEVGKNGQGQGPEIGD